MTKPIIVFPSTQAPIAILQLKPAAIIEEATSQLETAQASAIQYAMYEPVLHVRFDGGIGSKSALDALAVAAKLLGSWSTVNDQRLRLTGRVLPISVDEESPSIDPRPSLLSWNAMVAGVLVESYDA